MRKSTGVSLIAAAMICMTAATAGAYKQADLDRVIPTKQYRNFDLSGADLRSASLAGADLSGADLRGANLTGVDLSGANLTGANVSGVNLTDTNLTGANLTRAIFQGARLVRANLHEAYVDSTILDKADLTGIQMKGIHGAGFTLNGSQTDGHTVTADDIHNALAR